VRKTIGKSIAFILGFTVAITAVFLMAASNGKDEPGKTGPVPVYPTNAKGETYGIAADHFEDDPDLIAAINEDGVEGYYRYDEAHPNDPPKSPEEALSRQAEYKAQGGFHYVNLYDKEGEVIGKFRIGRAKGETEDFGYEITAE